MVQPQEAPPTFAQLFKRARTAAAREQGFYAVQEFTRVVDQLAVRRVLDQEKRLQWARDTYAGRGRSGAAHLRHQATLRALVRNLEELLCVGSGEAPESPFSPPAFVEALAFARQMLTLSDPDPTLDAKWNLAATRRRGIKGRRPMPAYQRALRELTALKVAPDSARDLLRAVGVPLRPRVPTPART
jgi:hypothetical protein